MSITASCGNCGKTYQAPDRMAGKSVRCKQCGEIFRIDASDVGLDLDGLEQSFAGDELATGGATAIHGTAHGTRQGPRLDEHGRPSIDRPDDVEAFSVTASHAPGFRSNYRFRYPGAKAVDQFLPPVLVVGTIALLAQACFTSGATVDEVPTPPIAVSRLAILLAAYLFIIWPASHIALRMASVKTRFSMPSAAIWRSFAAFTPVILMGGFLFAKSGGAGVALGMGLVVGCALAVGTVSLLFRVFANEVPTVAAYVAVGSLGSSICAVLAIVAINMLGLALARLDKSPTLFVSPIAVGMPWVDQPAVAVVTARNGPVVPKKPTTDAATKAVAVTPSPVVPRAATPLLPMALPEPSENGVRLVKSLDAAPVASGFDELLFSANLSKALGVVRDSGGGSVEVWDRNTWKRSSSELAQNFDRSQGVLIINTDATKIYRLVHNPTDRFEHLPLGNTDVLPPVRLLANPATRTVLGFVSENDIVVRASDADGTRLEHYPIAPGPALPRAVVFEDVGTLDKNPLAIEASSTTLRILPDASGVLIAARDPARSNTPLLALYHGLSGAKTPETVCDIALNDRAPFRPLGLAVRSSGQAAMLLDFTGEGSLTTWRLRQVTVDGKLVAAQTSPVLERRVGLLNTLRPNNWDDACDPLLWIDENTLLLYGSIVLDAHGGRRLGTLNIPGVIAQYPSMADGTLLFVQQKDRLNTLIQATLDPAALAQARGK